MDKMLPGYRFYPTEEELVSFYLTKQLEGGNVAGELNMNLVIPLLDVFEHEPWELPNLSGELCKGDKEQWFFFVPRQERENRGGRPSRTTSTGYWKATGSPGYVHSSNKRVIGVKKTMVFYKGKAPTGRKTKWKINEYRAIQEQETASSSGATIPKLRHEVSLCRVYVVSGISRAFDRRPLGVGPTEIASNQKVEGDPMAVTHPRGTQYVDHTNSLETSFSPPQLDHYEDPSGRQVEPAVSLWECEQHFNCP